jgi:adenosylcobinamide-GDP ribazoletransferase
MKRLILAMQFMTRLPLPSVAAGEGDFAAAIRWFPATGLAVGGVVAGAGRVGVGVDPWAGALLALIGWVAVTGALHLDGLGDIADATGAAHGDRDRLSAVLADPHIGSFGVVAIVLQLLAKLVLLRLALVAAPWWALIAVPALARIGPLVWTLVLPPLHEGLGMRFRGGLGWGHVAAWCMAGVVAAIFAPGLGIGALAIPLWGLWLASRIGGISGDGHGAGIEVVESACLLGLVLAR